MAGFQSNIYYNAFNTSITEKIGVLGVAASDNDIMGKYLSVIINLTELIAVKHRH